jgi:hypothetical protein
LRWGEITDFSLLSCPTLVKGCDMNKRTFRTGAGLHLAVAGRWLFSKTKAPMILLIFFTCLSVALASADSQATPVKKGNDSMQKAATISIKDVPPLDRSLPSRVETFTFGLG